MTMTAPHMRRKKEDFRQVVDELQEYLDGMVKAGILCGYSCSCITEKSRILSCGGVQGRGVHFENRPVFPGMYYDLASLTKVIGTTSRILQLTEAGELAFDTPVKSVLERFFHPEVTVGNLLLHNSGLMTEVAGKDGLTRENILDRVYQTPLLTRPGEQFLYSDTGFILLGEIIKALDHMSLEESFRKYVFAPLHMNHTSYLTSEDKTWYLPTEIRADRGLVWGEVHDKKAYLLGQSGSAGLFSTIEDLTVFAHAYLIRSPILFSDDLYKCLMEENRFGRTWGWSVEYGSGILYHTGFSGTSILLDLNRNQAFILLTNRIHPSRENDRFLEDRKKLNHIFLGRL